MNRLVLALILPPLLCAAAPPGSDPDSPAAQWFRSLRDARGISCCSESDCRRTMVRPRIDGGLEAWIWKDMYGPDAPNAWLPIPDEEVKIRGNRPPGVVGAIVCFYGGRVHCADLDGGF